MYVFTTRALDFVYTTVGRVKFVYFFRISPVKLKFSMLKVNIWGTNARIVNVAKNLHCTSACKALNRSFYGIKTLHQFHLVYITVSPP